MITSTHYIINTNANGSKQEIHCDTLGQMLHEAEKIEKKIGDNWYKGDQSKREVRATIVKTISL